MADGVAPLPPPPGSSAPGRGRGIPVSMGRAAPALAPAPAPRPITTALVMGQKHALLQRPGVGARGPDGTPVGRGAAMPVATTPLAPPRPGVLPAAPAPVVAGRGVARTPPVIPAQGRGRGVPVPVIPTGGGHAAAASLPGPPLVATTPAAAPGQQLPAYPFGVTPAVHQLLRNLEWPPTFLYEGLRRWAVRRCLSVGGGDVGGVAITEIAAVLNADRPQRALLDAVYPGRDGVRELVREFPDTFKMIVGAGGTAPDAVRVLRGRPDPTQTNPEAEDEAKRQRRVERDRKLREDWTTDDAGRTERQKQRLAVERRAALEKLHQEDVQEDIRVKVERLRRMGELVTDDELQTVLHTGATGGAKVVVFCLTQFERLAADLRTGRCPPGRIEERKTGIMQAATVAVPQGVPAAAAAVGPPSPTPRIVPTGGGGSPAPAPLLRAPNAKENPSPVEAPPKLSLDAIDAGGDQFLRNLAGVGGGDGTADAALAGEGGQYPVLYTGRDGDAPKELPAPPPLADLALPPQDDVAINSEVGGDAPMPDEAAGPTEGGARSGGTAAPLVRCPVTVMCLRRLGLSPAQLRDVFAQRLWQVLNRDFELQVVGKTPHTLSGEHDGVVFSTTVAEALHDMINVTRQVDAPQMAWMYAILGSQGHAAAEGGPPALNNLSTVQGGNDAADHTAAAACADTAARPVDVEMAAGDHAAPTVTPAAADTDGDAGAPAAPLGEALQAWAPPAHKRHGMRLSAPWQHPGLGAPREYMITPEIEWNMRYCGVAETDLRLTTPSTFAAIEKVMEESYAPPEAYDPCPYPNAGGVDGLSAPWVDEATRHSGKVFLHPPYSRIATWMSKAVIECRNGVHIVAVVPCDSAWLSSDHAASILGRFSRWPLMQQRLAHPVFEELSVTKDLLAFYMDPMKVAH